MNRNFLLLLPIVAIIAFYIFQHREALPEDKKSPKIPNTFSARGSVVKPQANGLPTQPILSRSDEAIKRSLESGKAWKALMTPEVKQGLVDARFLKYKVEYDAFFQQWNVDSDLAELVIATAKDRDYRLRENALANLNGGVRNHKEYTKQKALIQEAVAFELLAMLGADRSRALAEFEEDILERHRASVRRR